ncbi:ArsI/CadI family heavy metal resistance metalloenzyme [Plantactinospora sonchi]|uniref:ArsI/CadI family heavy metal resistance metalloenzyme n=1 Tax=Plantactinospora sonchi TaxID=1544735 RepID=A0ABU7RQ18_9ACTN
MSRVQLALRVSDLEGSVAFYSKLFGTEPAKRRPGYANFAIEQPPLKLVLLEGAPDQPTVLDHLGVEVFDREEVDAATERLTEAGLITLTENDTTCCYALQDKVWVRGPGDEPWEVYVVKGDSDQYGRSAEAQPGADDTCACGEVTDLGGKQAVTVGSGTAGGCCS